MAFTNRHHAQTQLALLLSLVCFGMSAHSSAQDPPLLIADDLPVLSIKEAVSGNCSSGHYVSVEDKYTLTYTSQASPQWLRAKIRVTGTRPAGQWGLRIVDGNGNEVETIDGKSRLVASDIAWTKILKGSTVVVNLRSSLPAEGLRVCIDSVNISKTQAGVTSLINGRDDREDLVTVYTTRSQYYDFSRSIALLRFQDLSSASNDETNCTAFAISRTLIVTNNHCISSDEQVPTATVSFKWETGETSPFEANVSGIAYTDPVLDFSILRIDRNVDSIARISLGDVRVGQKLILIQHPMAQRKVISVQKCKVQDVRARGRATDFFHLCDSSGGSSGSPVMDEHTGTVFGIHHLGVTDPKRNDYHNLAVYVSEMICDLKHNKQSLYAEITKEQNIADDQVHCTAADNHVATHVAPAAAQP